MAVERNDVHQGVPAVTVVTDGGWSKRSHKHSYNAKSGVAVIFGRETKKLLFLSVRNKFCSVCAIAEKRESIPQQHRCFKNWSLSSTAMEADMISEGFRLSESHHEVRYMRLIGDGDSSVMATITTTVPYGPFVRKIECANHACKAYRSRLEKLAKDHPEFRGKGGLTKRVIQRLTIGARIAIRMHSQTGNVQQLRHDLRNGPNHVLGDHTKCNSAFCTRSTSSNTDRESDSDIDNSDDIKGDDSDICEHPTLSEQIDSIISEELDDLPTATDEYDTRMSTSTQSPPSVNPELLRKIQSCTDRIVMMSPDLIANKTSNLAECYMSIRSNYDGGKYFNHIQSGSFQARCYAAGLRCQDGPAWILNIANHFNGSSSS